MNQLVCLKVGFSSEAPAAVKACEHFAIRVDFLVGAEGRALGKTFTAVRASKRFLAGVKPHVLDQAEAPFKKFIAYGTLVLLIIRVNSLVRYKVSFASKTFTALQADKRFLPGMDSPMDVQRRLLGKISATFVTHQHFIAWRNSWRHLG